MKTHRAVQSIVDLIVRCVDPDKIILFGSFAQGRARADSDIDLLVIGEFRESKALRGMELKGLLRSFPVPVDLHLRNAKEIQAETREANSFADSVVRHGVVVYERDPRKEGRP